MKCSIISTASLCIWLSQYFVAFLFKFGSGVPVTPLYGVRGSTPEDFGFGPCVRLGGPTYVFMHDFRTSFLDVTVFGQCYWMLRHV